jgi:branched-chain amino acid transport system substrate-binding protein
MSRTSTRSRASIAVAAVTIVLTATACSSSSKSTAGSTSPAGPATTSSGSSSASVASSGGAVSSPATPAGPAKSIDRSFVLGSIEPMTGSNILSTYINGVRMAVKDINAAGGIGGKPIVLKEYDDALDAQKTVNAVKLAISDKVDAIIGMPATIENNATAKLIEAANIIYLNAGVSTPVATGEANAGPMTFRIMTPMPELIYAEGQYITNTLSPKPTNIGLTGLDIDYGQKALPQFKSIFTAAGIKTTGGKLVPYTATDVTSEVLAMKGADTIVDWNYPNQEILGLKSVQANGLGNVPYFGGPSSSIINSRALVSKDLLKNLYGVQSCDPNSDSRAYVQDWAKKYKADYGAVSDYAAPSMYDAVHFLKQAVESVGSTDHAAVATAMKTITYDQNTMCASSYHVDDRNQLSHEAVEMTFVGGVAKQIKHYTATDLAGHGLTQ